VQEIEGKEHDAVRRFVDGRPEGFKVGDALLILDDDLAIDQASLTAQVGASIDRPAIWSGPIPAAAGESSDLALVNDGGQSGS
jgi:hypothetical protein